MAFIYKYEVIPFKCRNFHTVAITFLLIGKLGDFNKLYGLWFDTGSSICKQVVAVRNTACIQLFLMLMGEYGIRSDLQNIIRFFNLPGHIVLTMIIIQMQNECF